MADRVPIAQAPAFELPRADQRVAIFGKTGSGKTQMGVWLLSETNFDTQPWIILDYKRDHLLNSIDRIKQIGLDQVPADPGLYIVHLDPEDSDSGGVDAWFRKVSERENVGLYIDETYEIPGGTDFRRILTQGRSKRIPVISLSQRPAWIPRFILSEAEHIVVFHLNHKMDRKKIEEFVPDDKLDLSERLPKYNSRWYNVDLDHTFQILPVPDATTLIKRLDERLAALEPETDRPWL